MKRFFIFLFVCILAISGNITTASAQCAMCKATVESNSKTGNTSIGKGLNKGILYLMIIPYILVGVIGYLWYVNSRKNAQRINIARNIKGKMSPLQKGESF